MEKRKPSAGEVTSSLNNLHLRSEPKAIPSSPSFPSYSLPMRSSKPRRLVSLCLGVLGQYFDDIVADLREVAAVFPPDIKLAMVAIARRKKLLNDDILITLADTSWNILDISGSDVTDFGLTKVSQICVYLKAVDLSRCEHITTVGVSDLILHCQSLEILRCGGCPRSEFTARRCLSILKPKLNDVEEESWEELDDMDIGNGAQSLRWLIWPKVDEDSKMSLSTECPRIIVNPQPSSISIRGLPVPKEALACIPLDHSVVEDIDPKTWAHQVATRRLPMPPASDAAQEMHIAERFRLAFLERDARLARKRVKNERQHRRRALRDWLMSDVDAKSVALASQASKSLQNKS